MKSSQRSDAGSKQASQKLLVIGDWLLDENWVTGKHRGAISSRTGGEHLRALHHHDNALYRIAGAGQTASVLYCALKDGPAPQYRIYGVGVWDQQDSAAMKALLDLDQAAEVRPSQYRITRPITDDSCTAELFNLGKIVDEKEKCKERKYRSGTMRAIRIYQHSNGRLELKERIDWEPRIFDDHTAWIGIGEQAVLSTKDLEDAGLHNLVRDETDATAIVVQDLGKGVMSAPLVKWLTKLAPKAQWFISTKAWRPARDPAVPEEEPDWLHELERAEADVRLLLIPEAAAQRAVDEGALSRWIVTAKDDGGPSYKALKLTDELARHFPKAAIVVLPRGFAFIARDPGTDPETSQCIVQSESGIADSVGASIMTVLFPAITAHMLQGKPADLREKLDLALGFTRRSWEQEVERIKHSEKKPIPQQRPQVFDGDGKEKRFFRWSTDEWDLLAQEWEQALEGCGIIDGERPRIELWRAMIDIDGFVCCVPTKRYAIGRIRRELDLFKRNPHLQRRAASFMVVAPPGSGKTHFVKRLAKSCDLSLVQFSITQLNKKDDILDCFDAIVTRQAQDDRPLLVFFDEINACLNGQHVYDSFLAAIEEGIYVRGGKTFRMPACAWLFAGTENPAEHPDKSTKGSDFVSRLSLPPIDVQLEAGEEADLNTEHVYLGVSLLKQAFSDVREVSNKVLQAFEYIRPDVDVRQIIHFVNSFSDVQHEKVLSRNIPLDQLKSLTHPHISHRHHFDKWKELGELGDSGEMIAIESEGPVRHPSTDHVYLGRSQMEKVFPGAKQVSEKVLKAFEFIRPKVGARQIRHFVNSFSGVQEERVLSSNIPLEQLKSLTYPDASHLHHFDKWKELEEGNLVEIKEKAA